MPSLGLRGRYPRLPHTGTPTKPDVGGCTCIKIGGVHLSVPKKSARVLTLFGIASFMGHGAANSVSCGAKTSNLELS